ncbi:DUF6990 domain-containing protein [Pseudomonas aeruginosa]|uniref:DUF6990 domain-containing protein n=1 Tax=Pseudomonas aeruginosa TaxID=287 RepID=UPI0039DF967A
MMLQFQFNDRVALSSCNRPAYRALPTNSKGAMPLRNLAALAIAGDVSCLANYQFSFEQGDRLGFVPYITQDMIERALLIARNVR